MKPCVLYFSRTRNTNRLAEAISESIEAPAFDIAVSEPSVVENFDLLILGTPVEGSRPAKEASAFIERLPKAEDKKTILFCTYALWKGRTFNILKKGLSRKGYTIIIDVSKKGMKPDKPADFSEIINKIKKSLQK